MQQRTGALKLLAGVASVPTLLFFMLLLSCSWSCWTLLDWLQHAENVWGRHSIRTSFTRLALHQGKGTPGTRPGITETAPELNGRWNRRLNESIQ
eukprot:1154388-Pelagomonas_calceolata.AAC.1